MNESLLPASNTPTPNKLYWSAQISLFNKTYTTDYFNQPSMGVQREAGLEGQGEGEGENSAFANNNNNNNNRAAVQFGNKRAARNNLAVSILKEVDIAAYEEMLTGQQNVRKTLQTYRDGVISG
jgi:hypothetical protein